MPARCSGTVAIGDAHGYERGAHARVILGCEREHVVSVRRHGAEQLAPEADE